jgi:hypothetical protein
VAPTLIASYPLVTSAVDSSTLTTPSFTPANGEVIVVKGATWDSTQTMSTHFRRLPALGGDLDGRRLRLARLDDYQLNPVRQFVAQHGRGALVVGAAGHHAGDEQRAGRYRCRVVDPDDQRGQLGDLVAGGRRAVAQPIHAGLPRQCHRGTGRRPACEHQRRLVLRPAGRCQRGLDLVRADRADRHAVLDRRGRNPRRGVRHQLHPRRRRRDRPVRSTRSRTGVRAPHQRPCGPERAST